MSKSKVILQEYKKRENRAVCEVFQEAGQSRLVLAIEQAQDLKRIFLKLRQELSAAAYQQQKEDEEKGATKALHQLAFASLVKPHLLDLYIEFSLQQGLGQFFEPELFLEGEKIANLKGFIRNDLTPSYLFNYFHVAWGAILSTFVGKAFKKFLPLKCYDPRVDLHNNGGPLFEEKFSRATCLTIFTPTPTLDDEPAPETHAILQGMKNRLKFSQERLEQDPYPFIGWIYINLQNINASDEGPRALSIMNLKNQYPKNFFPLTLAVDTSFYRPKAKDDDKPFTVSYSEEMLAQLLHPINFSFDDRGIDGDPGYFFPHEGWIKTIPPLVEEAFLQIERKKSAQQFSNRDLHIAFRELVQLSIIRTHEQESFKTLFELTGFSHVNSLMSITCKESMDRGVNKNGALLWALQGKNDFKKPIFSFIHSRALFSRFRLVRQERIKPFLTLAKLFSKTELKNFLDQIDQKFTMNSIEVNPVTFEKADVK